MVASLLSAKDRTTLAIAVSILFLILSACKSKSLDEQLLEEAGSPFSDVAKVKDLLAKGARVDSIDDTGKTALMKAAWMGRVEILRALLDADAGIKHTDRYGYTSLDGRRTRGTTLDTRRQAYVREE